MNIKIDSPSKMSLTTPLFLFLHVPTSKQEMTHIDIIIEQINKFLFTISDIKVSILNERFVSEQVERVISLYNETESFQYYQSNNSFLDFPDAEVTVSSGCNTIECFLLLHQIVQEINDDA